MYACKNFYYYGKTAARSPIGDWQRVAFVDAHFGVAALAIHTLMSPIGLCAVGICEVEYNFIKSLQ